MTKLICISKIENFGKFILLRFKLIFFILLRWEFKLFGKGAFLPCFLFYLN